MTNPTVDNVELASQADVAALEARVAKLEAASNAGGATGPAGPAGPQGVPGASAPTADAIVQALIDQLAKGVTVVSSGGGTSTAASGTTSSTPAVSAFTGATVGTASDPNVYPLAMPVGVVNSAPVALGVGPDTLNLSLSNNPGSSAVTTFNVLFIRPDGSEVAVAGPLTVSASVGETNVGDQVFSIKGPWGSNPKFSIMPSAGGNVAGAWIMEEDIDLIPLGLFGQVDSRGAVSNGQVGDVFDSNGQGFTLMLPSNAPAAATGTAAPAATQTVIGTQTLSQLLASVAPGSTTTLPAETIIGTGLIGTGLIPQAATITGAGMGKTIIDATGVAITQSKGVLVVGAPGAVISNMTIQNGYIVGSLGLNGAGVRNVDSSEGFTLSGVELTGNQNGVLTDSASVGPFLIENCYIHGNGEVTKPGNTHNIYIGGVSSAVLTLNSNIFSGCRDAHEVKSRCGTTISSGNTITTGGNGSCFDIPNAGILTSTGDTLILPVGAGDENFVTYAMENGNNAAFGQAVTFTNAVFKDGTGTGGIIQANASNAPSAVLNLVGCTYTGSVAPQIKGFATVNGTITKAA